MGVPGSSAQWGTWVGCGMSLRDPGTLQRSEQFGLGVVMPELGLAVLAAFMNTAATSTAATQVLQVGVVSAFAWSTFMQQLADPGIFSEYGDLAPVRAAAAVAAGRKCRRSKRAVGKAKVHKPASSARLSSHRSWTLWQACWGWRWMQRHL